MPQPNVTLSIISEAKTIAKKLLICHKGYQPMIQQVSTHKQVFAALIHTYDITGKFLSARSLELLINALWAVVFSELLFSKSLHITI